ncbi:MAG: hypothetical protein B7X90_13555 [Novosphingobium sp. 17-62-19]|nr:MAG: hypothetical protein B7Y74_02215 [Novosphingobium sp. 35-62-5]OZA17867.1 MAG: hypothetical protein B7X90_13555 [Novosphingobium sp. 17-62-19]HQS97688.1 DUF2793 domain-containing protein [Novosphingobium sp.]
MGRRPIFIPQASRRVCAVRSIPMLAGQSQKETTVNESLIMLDMLLSGSVQGISNTPPSTPLPGEVWIVGNLPTGAFAGHTDSLAGWTDGGWRFVQPSSGFRVQDLDTGSTRVFGNGWQLAETPVLPTGGQLIDTEARAAIAAIIAGLKVAGIFSASV